MLSYTIILMKILRERKESSEKQCPQNVRATKLYVLVLHYLFCYSLLVPDFFRLKGSQTFLAGVEFDHGQRHKG